mgnify:CR=1 FL=1
MRTLLVLGISAGGHDDVRGLTDTVDRPGCGGGLVMPWRAGWWCGCDGSGVRWRRATGRRGWRGGGGCGCNSSPIGRWRSRGRRGPSSGRRTRGACGPPGALLPGAQVAAGSSRDPPGARVEAARPRGRGSPSRSRGGVRHDLLEGGRDRAARVTWTGPVLHPDPVRTAQTRRGPRSSSPALVDALGGSAAGALTLRRHGHADALRPIAPSRPRPAARDAGSPVRRAPSPVVPGRLPATDPPRPEPTASAARSRAARRSRAALRFWRCERCWEAVTVSTVPVMCRDACWARGRPPVPARRMTLSKQPGGRLAAGPQRLPGGPP